MQMQQSFRLLPVQSVNVLLISLCNGAWLSRVAQQIRHHTAVCIVSICDASCSDCLGSYGEVGSNENGIRLTATADLAGRRITKAPIRRPCHCFHAFCCPLCLVVPALMWLVS